MPKSKTVDFTAAVPCYVCGVLEHKMPKFHAYPICSRCREIKPGELLAMDSPQQKRYATAIAFNYVVPDVGALITQSLSATLSKALKTRVPQRIKTR